MPDNKDIKSILLIVIIIVLTMLIFFIGESFKEENTILVEESELIVSENIIGVGEEIIMEEGEGINLVNYSISPELLQDIINESGEEAIYDVSGLRGSDLDEAREKLEEMKLEENIDFENVTLEQAEEILINVLEEVIEK